MAIKVALVTSIAFGANDAACFNSGFNSSIPPDLIFPAKGNYSDLKNKVAAAVATNPDLIVAAGGLVTAEAVTAFLGAASTPKFIYLAGDIPPGNNPACAGGVDINNPGELQERKKKLTTAYPQIDSANIYMVYNFNNPMKGEGWTGFLAPFFASGGNPVDPTLALNDTEFPNLSAQTPKPSGLIISGDPYFRYWRSAFTLALGTILPIPVCYPYQDYLTAITPNGPNINNSIAFDGPRLNNHANPADNETAYYMLGLQAARFASGTMNVGVEKWDPSTHKWKP